MTRKKSNSQIFKYIELIAPSIPNPFYWKDKNGVALGLNQAGIDTLEGLITKDDFIGKTNHNIYPKEIADELTKSDIEVLKHGKIENKEEVIELPNGKRKYFAATKMLLKNEANEIIGFVGNSIEITTEKEAQYLVQKEQETFRKLIGQMIHDIQSPLASLQMIMAATHNIPELERITLRTAAANIADVTNNMLKHYKVHSKIETQKEVIVSALLLEIISEKRYEYKDADIKFAYKFESNACFAFIRANANNLRNAISNIINNARDALLSKNNRKIEIILSLEQEYIAISIKDNGKGMSEGMIDKIQNGIAFSQDKINGHSIGLTQVKDTIHKYFGRLEIASQQNIGTTLKLLFPKIVTPIHFVEEIIIMRYDIIVILDDDTSIHSAWDMRLKNIAKVKHFTYALDAIAFINSIEDKGNILFLTDYELIDQNTNGLEVIKEVNVRRSILVTSHYNNDEIYQNAFIQSVQILPKTLVSMIEIKAI